MEEGAESSNSRPMCHAWQSITKHHFPTVFKDGLSQWPCVNWTIEEWATRCGDIFFKFRSPSKSNVSHWETESVYTQAKLSEFVTWLKNKPSDLPNNHPLKATRSDVSWCYSSYNYMAEVFQNHAQLLDVVDWSAFGLEGRGGNESTLWIGSRGSNTPCHQDTYGSNLVAQLIGEKLWVLFAPDSSASLYPTRVPYEESSVFSSIDTLHPDLLAFPLYRNARPYFVVLKPGDVLYVPPKWWHFVYCLDTAVSINTWVEHELDDQWRLEEAVVRFAISAFIPTYKDIGNDWINPTEELFSSSETARLLKMALDKAKQRSPELTKEPDAQDSHPSLEHSFELQPQSFKNFENEMSKLTPYQACNGKHKTNELVDMLNCFLANNVIQVIANNLK